MCGRIAFGICNMTKTTKGVTSISNIPRIQKIFLELRASSGCCILQHTKCLHPKAMCRLKTLSVGIILYFTSATIWRCAEMHVSHIFNNAKYPICIRCSGFNFKLCITVKAIKSSIARFVHSLRVCGVGDICCTLN